MLPPRLRSPRPLLLIAAVGAPLALGACTAQSSGNSFKGTKGQVQDVITKLSDHADDRKAADICNDLFTDQLKASFAKAGGGDCAKAVDRAVRNADYTRLTADTIELDGPEASATTAIAKIKVIKDGPTRVIRLVKSQTKAPWLIDGFTEADSTGGATLDGTTPTTPKSTTP
ncbi:MAG: hypothetical protein J7513_06565 [Solirubrobacteraceae bacterium]|nr:hypothetical protein [Solirubrobacteraceae bacterium]